MFAPARGLAKPMRTISALCRELKPKSETGRASAVPQARGAAVDKALAFGAPLAQQALLRDGSHQCAVARKDQPAGETARAVEIGAVLGIEQPIIGAERPMKPERVVEARRHDVLLEHRASVGDQRGIEQHHVGRIGQHALVDRGLVRQPTGGADPDVEAAVLELLAEVALELDRAQLDRPLALVVAPYRVGHGRQHALLDGVLARQVFRFGHVRHLRLVRETGLVTVE